MGFMKSFFMGALDAWKQIRWLSVNFGKSI